MNARPHTTLHRGLLAAAAAVSVASTAHADSATVQWHSQQISSNTVRIWADVVIDAGAGQTFAGTRFRITSDDTSPSPSISHDELQGLGRLFRYPNTTAGADTGAQITGIDEFQLPQSLSSAFNSATTLSHFFELEYTITDFTPRTITFSSVHDYFRVYTAASGTNMNINWVAVPTSFDVGCPADYNNSGAATVQDIFDFLAGYFANDPRADFNHSGLITVQDIFDFLAAYFTGCA